MNALANSLMEELDKFAPEIAVAGTDDPRPASHSGLRVGISVNISNIRRNVRAILIASAVRGVLAVAWGS